MGKWSWIARADAEEDEGGLTVVAWVSDRLGRYTDNMLPGARAADGAGEVEVETPMVMVAPVRVGDLAPIGGHNR